MSETLPVGEAVFLESRAAGGYDVILRVTPEYIDGIGGHTEPKLYHAVAPIAPVAIQTLKMGEISPIACSISRDSAQALLEGLWEAGLRPKKPETPCLLGGGEDNRARVVQLTNQLDSARLAHITDLRRVAGLIKPIDQPAATPGVDPI